ELERALELGRERHERDRPRGAEAREELAVRPARALRLGAELLLGDERALEVRSEHAGRAARRAPRGRGDALERLRESALIGRDRRRAESGRPVTRVEAREAAHAL